MTVILSNLFVIVTQLQGS